MAFTDSDDTVSLHLPTDLYQELFDCEVDPYETANDSPAGSQHQFVQAMILAEDVGGDEVFIELTPDALVYFLNTALPTNMEMWTSWGSIEGDELLAQAKQILDDYNVYYPY